MNPSGDRAAARFDPHTGQGEEDAGHMPSRETDPTELIVLTGLMGTGKTTTARLLSQALDLPMTDSDGYLDRHYGSSAAETVATEGIAVLHEREREHVLDALAHPPCVIAAGASVVTDAAVRRALQPAFTVWLDAPDPVLERRMRTGGHRPDFDPAALRAGREPYYREVADLVVDVADNTPPQVARLILDALAARR